MKRFLGWAALLIIIGTVVLYFADPSLFSRARETVLSRGNPLASLFLEKTSQTAGRVAEQITTPLKEGAEGFAARAKETVKETVAEKTAVLGESISEGVSGAVGGIVQAGKEKIAEALGIPTALPTSSISDLQSANLNICAIASNPVSYLIGNPFMPPEDFSFQIDWGDHINLQGDMNTNSPQRTVSHRYEKRGSYMNTFLVTAGNKTVTIERKVCVE